MKTSLTLHRNPGALAGIALCLSLAGCASAPPTPDVDFNPSYDFSAVTTVGMYRESGEVTGENPNQLSDMARDRIDTALQRALTDKGLSLTEDITRADLLLSWHLVTETKTDVRTFETPAISAGRGMGIYSPAFYPYNAYSRYNCWNCMPTQTEVSLRDYTLGTFIVDLIDPALGKSVWRSVTRSRLNGQFDRDQDKYDAAATLVLEAFPPD